MKSSHVTLRVIAIRSPTKTASYFASLLDAEKRRVKDYSMMDPFVVAKTISIPIPLLFEAPSTFFKLIGMPCDFWGEVGDQIGQYLAFDRCARLEFEPIVFELRGPF